MGKGNAKGMQGKCKGNVKGNAKGNARGNARRLTERVRRNKKVFFRTGWTPKTTFLTHFFDALFSTIFTFLTILLKKVRIPPPTFFEFFF